jgi:serine/threonine protein kinase
VDSDHRARLSDFGLATTIVRTDTIAAFTEMSGNRGSLRYMAPELLDHMAEIINLTTQADVYGFAMALWEVKISRMS